MTALRKKGIRFKRPLHFGLRSADILFLMDIPKSGGEYIYPLLADRFPEERVLPYEDGDQLVDLLEDAAMHRAWPYRLTSAKHDYRIYRHFPRKPVYLAMLRDPVERTVDCLRSIGETGQDQTFSSPGHSHWESLGRLLDTLEVQEAIKDQQTRFLVGISREGDEGLSAESLLEIAKIRLDEFAFFGLTEDLPNSARLLDHTFDWSERTQSAYSQLKGAARSACPPELRDRIEALNPLDVALYSYAVELFRQRIDRMDLDARARRRAKRRRVLRSVFDTVGGLANPSHPLRVVLGRWRRRLIPAGSRFERLYLQVRQRLLGW